MKIDEIDLFILEEIYKSYKKNKDNSETSTWTMAKKWIEKIKGDSKDVYQLTLLCNKLMWRMEKFVKAGFVVKYIEGGEKKYVLNLDKVDFVRRKFNKKYAPAIVIKIEKEE